MRRILITGAGGMIAPDLAHALSGDYALRVSDVIAVDTARFPDVEYVHADLADSDAVASAVDGVDAVVHLGAVTWDEGVHARMIPSNVSGVYNLFDAARLAGVERIVLASTHHTVGFHHVDGTLDLPESAEARPDTFYAVTKLYGEALARYYHERFAMRCYCLRIGYYMTPKRIAEGFGRYKEALILSPRDFASMVRLCLTADEPRFGIYNCISTATRPWLSIDKARSELGYDPVDTVATLFGNVAPAAELTPDDFAWMYGDMDAGPER